MRTPAFWNTRNTWSTLLWPLSSAYDMIGTLRRAYTKPVVLPIPVICIGNLTAGGAGKTPVAMHVGKLLKEKNIGAFFLSRGYGGKARGPLLVDPNKHLARDVGDEPLLLAQILPTVIAKDKISGARLAIARGAQAIVMDDGFQNPTIAKTLSLVVIDGQTGFRNGKLLPAGPLREPPEIGLKRAHAAIVINRTTVAPEFPQDFPVLFARTQPLETTGPLKGKKIVAFCGIARPGKFFDTIASLGGQLAEAISFPDHYYYSESDITAIAHKAREHQALVLTTPKDAVRLPPAFKGRVTTLDMMLDFDNPALLDALLDYAINPHAPA